MQPEAKNRIKYIAFYYNDKFDSRENRNYHLSAVGKIDYICEALNRIGYDVDIISPSWTENSKGYYKDGIYNLTDNISVKTFSTFGSSNSIIKKAKQVYSAFQLLLFLLFKTKRKEQIIVYHSLALMLPIKAARFIKKLEVILEVEEIYTEVWKDKRPLIDEKKYIDRADKYILVSDVLKEMLPPRPSVVLYGAFNNIKIKTKDKDDNRTINAVYAGAIEDVRGGALNTVRCAQLLPEGYRVHILGFGEDAAIAKLKGAIEAVNSKKGFEACKYHGTKTGEEYSDFLMNCDIGINPQFAGDYMNTAFPSKILVYLSHGLKVVSTDIKSIRMSAVAEKITFSKDDSPEAIAEAVIKAASKENSNAENTIKRLDEEFVKGLNSLI